MTPRIGEDFVQWKPPTGSDSTLGVVDFSIFPHLFHYTSSFLAGIDKHHQ
jgi:dipeptidase E